MRAIRGGVAINPASQWQLPLGKWELLVDNVIAPGSANVYPDEKKYELRVNTLCQNDMIAIEATPTQTMSGFEFVRRAQLAGSIQHVMTQGCVKCRECYMSVTAKEREWLTTTAPQLGRVLGFGATAAQLATLAGHS